jgi:uncharacterized membrane protein
MKPLTYQPFAETPAVDDLREDLTMNVPDGERALSAFAGASLIGVAFGRESFLAKIALLALGGALIQRGITGHCPVYSQTARNRRHPGRGVPEQQGRKFEDAITIHRPASVLFHFWRDLEQLPRVLRHIKSVEALNDKKSRWTAAGPASVSLSWEAEIINEEENRLIAWESLPGSVVRTAGSVRFEENGLESTEVKISMVIDPPGGAAALSLAEAFGRSPEADLAEDLARFKEFAESGLK